MKIQLDNLKKIHIIGIGGIGVSYIAHYFLERGTVVTGSDLTVNQVVQMLAKKGAVVFSGHSADNVREDVDLIIYSPAVPEDNPEITRARELSIPMLSHFEFLRIYALDKKTIAIAGNKGKTTTSAMLAEIMTDTGCDPSAMIGSIVNSWQCNYKKGRTDYLVVEADEYKEKFLLLNPQIEVITNIKADHLDYYKTQENVVAAFQKFVKLLPNNGVLVINRDDELTKKLNLPDCKIIDFSLKDSSAQVYGENMEVDNQKQQFKLFWQGSTLGKVYLPMPGKMNIENALAAIAVALELGIDIDKVKRSLERFSGTWRRFQILGEYNNCTVVSDYAHTPGSVHAVIDAARDFYGERRLVVVFQPHSLSRTKTLFSEFVACLNEADLILIPDIYYVAGREDLTEKDINSSMLVESIKNRDKTQNPKRVVQASGNLKQTKELLDQLLKKDDVILFAGAGTINQLAENLNKYE